MKTIYTLLVYYFIFIYLSLLLTSSIYLIISLINIYRGYLLLPHQHKLFTMASCYLLICLAIEGAIILSFVISSIADVFIC